MIAQLLNPILINIAEVQITELKKQMQKAKKDASGGTSKSLHYTVVITDDFAGVTVKGEKAFEYINYGRRAGAKMPPKGSLDSWYKVRGTPIKYDYIIRKNIGLRGIKAVPVLDMTQKATFDNSVQSIMGVLTKAITSEMIVKAKALF